MNNTNFSRQEVPHAIKEKRVYSIDEVAGILGVGKGAVYSLCKQKAFHFVRVGSAIRISKPSFDAWLEQN
jgi:excisionase family DNA binding protein